MMQSRKRTRPSSPISFPETADDLPYAKFEIERSDASLKRRRILPPVLNGNERRLRFEDDETLEDDVGEGQSDERFDGDDETLPDADPKPKPEAQSYKQINQLLRHVHSQSMSRHHQHPETESREDDLFEQEREETEQQDQYEERNRLLADAFLDRQKRLQTKSPQSTETHHATPQSPGAYEDSEKI